MKLLIFLPLIASLLTFTACVKPIHIGYLSQFNEGTAWMKIEQNYGIIDTSFIPRKVGWDSLLLTPGANFNANFEVYGIYHDSLLVYNASTDSIRVLENTSANQRFQLDDQGFVYKDVIVRSETKQYFKGQSEKMGGITSEGDTVIPFDFRVIRLGIPNEFIAVMGQYLAERYKLFNLEGELIWNTYNVAIVPWNKKYAYWFQSGGNILKLYQFSKRPESETQIALAETIHPGSLPSLESTIGFNKNEIFKLEGDTVIPANDFCWIRSAGKWQRIDTSFQLEAKKYDAVHMNEHWGVVWNKDKVAFVDVNGELISDFKYHGVIDDYISSSPWIVAYGKKEIHVLDTSGNIKKSFSLSNDQPKKAVH